jgi:hypothetical protein
MDDNEAYVRNDEPPSVGRPRLDEGRSSDMKFGYRPEPCTPGQHTFEGEYPNGRCLKCGTPVIDT